jgi:O-antigen/teichoic acid export membrane protein
VIAPCFRLALTLALVTLAAPVTLLAYGHVVSGLLGVTFYLWSVARVMRREGLLRKAHIRGVPVPVRAVFAYTLPVAAADVLAVSMAAAGPLLIGYFAGLEQVALFKVVVPLVMLVDLVSQAFGVLYEPTASRLYARGERAEMDRFYWRCTTWVAVLSFPVFAISFTTAEPLTVLLYGDRYRDAAPVLSLVALGVFFSSTLAFCGPLLRLAGRIRWLLASTLVAALTNLGLGIWLIPRWGALGAAVAFCAAQLVCGVLRQLGLPLTGGVKAMGREFLAPFLAIALATLPLVALRILMPGDLPVLAGAAALASIGVFAAGRTRLTITKAFPELGRSRVLRFVLG